jgi:hypothetical protein
LIFKRIGLAFGDVRQHSCALGVQPGRWLTL